MSPATKTDRTRKGLPHDKRRRLVHRHPKLLSVNISDLVTQVQNEDDERLDWQSLADPALFQSRFGTTFGWTPVQRAALIEFKRRHRLRDWQIQWLRYTSAIDVKSMPGHVRFIAPRWLAFLGWIKLAIFGGIFAVYLVSILPQAVQSAVMSARYVVCVFVVLAFCWTIHAVYVWPWNTGRRLRLLLPGAA